MAINLVGKNNGEEEQPTEPTVIFHLPEEDLAETKTKNFKPKSVEQKDVPKVITAPHVDLSESIRKRRKVIKVSVFSLLVSLFIAGSGSATYLLIKNFNRNQPTLTTPTVQETAPVSLPVVEEVETFEPVEESQPVVTEPGQLPPTALAPLRGALVRFDSQGDIFLIENNGELRIVNQSNVRFKNGQTLSQINKTLIYNLPQKWKDIRRGSEIVSGQVDFDPRVLLISELLPFIQ